MLQILRIFPHWPILSCNKKYLRRRRYSLHQYKWLRRNRRRSMGLCWGGMWNWRLFTARRWGCNARMQFQESFKDFLEPSYFNGLCFFRKLQIESSHFHYTKGIHVFSCAMYRSSSSGCIAVIHERKFKPIINIKQARQNTVEIIMT